MRVLPGPVTDERAHNLRRRYLELFGGAEFPVPVESIAEDLLGLEVERTEIDVSGMLFPAERRILVNAAEAETRQRFTIAHELGHWVCQCLEGRTEPVYCRAEDVGVDPEAKALEREANVFAAELLMPEEDGILWPACVGERGTFMSQFAFDRTVKHPYASFSSQHEHIGSRPSIIRRVRLPSFRSAG